MPLVPCLIDFVVVLLVIAIVFYALEWALGGIPPIPQPFWNLVRLLVVLLVLLWFLNCLGVFPGFHYGVH